MKFVMAGIDFDLNSESFPMGIPKNVLDLSYFLRSRKIIPSFLFVYCSQTLGCMYICIFMSKLYLYVSLLLGMNYTGKEPVVKE